MHTTATTTPATPPTPHTPRKQRKSAARLPAVDTQLLERAATALPESALGLVDAHRNGLTATEAQARLEQWGPNLVRHQRPPRPIVQYLRTLRNPFILILIGLVAIMFVTDVLLADPEEGADWFGVLTISTMVLVSSVMRFWQEFRSSRAAERLAALVRTPPRSLARSMGYR